MTYNNTNENYPILTVKYKGITCVSDLGVYENQYRNNNILLLSLYGSPQSVKAIMSAFAGAKIVSIDNMDFSRLPNDTLHFKVRNLQWGKCHGMLWHESIKNNVVLWTSPEERLQAFKYALSKRKIPFIDEWLPQIETMLIKKKYIEKLSSWGPIEGYKVTWYDNIVCNLIVKHIYPETNKNTYKKEYKQAQTYTTSRMHNAL